MEAARVSRWADYEAGEGVSRILMSSPEALKSDDECDTSISMALSVRLPEEIETRLEALAQKTGRTKTFYIREAILEHIEDLEDYYLALERIQNPAGDPISLDDVIARLGLVDSV